MPRIERHATNSLLLRAVWLCTLLSTYLAAESSFPDRAAPSSSFGTWATTLEGPLHSGSPLYPLGNQAYSLVNDEWCNMPHVRKDTYKAPPKEYTLVYVEVIQRHHKRTPYSSNLFYQGDALWDCQGVGPLYGLKSQTSRGSEASAVQWQSYVDNNNPFTDTLKAPVISSNCQFPQLTTEGLEDSIIHGSDLREVYGPLLRLSHHPNSRECVFRVTNNQITSQVASGILRGFYPLARDPDSAAVVIIQPASIDSLEPRYPCPRANSLRDSYTTGSNGSQWNAHLQRARDDGTFKALDDVSGISPDDGEWHVSFDHYFDNLKARQCHSKPLPCNTRNTSLCIPQTQANRVYEIGNWEYSYLYRDGQGSTAYSALRFGVWMLELESRLKSAISATSKVKYTHNIAHDGSISALLGFLQVSTMTWPGMGSEVVFELYRRGGTQSYLRVLWKGTPIQTSTSLGVLDLVPVDVFFSYIHSLVSSGQRLREECSS